MRAGRKVFADKGLGGASLRQDILAKAGVSVGSFYHQFSDKADLLAEIIRHDSEAVLETLQKGQKAERSTDIAGVVEQGRRLIGNIFDMGDRHPEFVKIYVREYYSDSPAVRREIRSHRQRCIERTRLPYEALRGRTGISLDIDAIATLISVQSSAVVNYYLDFPKKKRPEVRERLTRSLLQQAVGGVLAMREVEESAGPEADTTAETKTKATRGV